MEPKNYIIQIQDSYLNQFIYYWIQYEKPCSILFQKPITNGLTAIKMVIDTNESAEFLHDVKEATGCKVHLK